MKRGHIRIIQADDQAQMPLDAFSAEHLSILYDRNTGAEFEDWLPENAQLEQWVVATLSHSLTEEQQGKMIEISLTCVSSDEIRELNTQYRSKNSVTNVLSFPADMPVLPADNNNKTPTLVLGDVVVCPQVLNTEAIQQNKSIKDHWAHMLVHSVLHLTGSDHEDVSAAEAMESLEIQILSRLGIANPYVAVSAVNHE